jgi:hypothetical protein
LFQIRNNRKHHVAATHPTTPKTNNISLGGITISKKTTTTTTRASLHSEQFQASHYFFLKMEDNLNFLKRKTTSSFMKMEDELKTIVQPSTIKSKTRVVAPLRVT